jgi:hypothetical protein
MIKDDHGSSNGFVLRRITFADASFIALILFHVHTCSLETLWKTRSQMHCGKCGPIERINRISHSFIGIAAILKKLA